MAQRQSMLSDLFTCGAPRCVSCRVIAMMIMTVVVVVVVLLLLLLLLVVTVVI